MLNHFKRNNSFLTNQPLLFKNDSNNVKKMNLSAVVFSLGTFFEQKVLATTFKNGGGRCCLATKNEACWN